MKNYIDSEQHWEDSVNADYDYKKSMEKEQEDNREQPDNREKGQELPIHVITERYSYDEVSNIMTEMQNEAQTGLYTEKRWDMQKRLGIIRDKWKR